VLRVASQALALVVAAYLLFLPFHLRYEGVFAGLERWRGSRTSVADYLTIHGLFMFVIVSSVLVDLWTSPDANGLVRSARLSVRHRHRLGDLRGHRSALVRRTRSSLVASRLLGLTATGAAALALTGYGVPALGLLVGGLVVTALVRRPARRPHALGRVLWQMTLLLVLVGLMLTLVVEFLVVRNIDVGRTNTVFKTYMQVWVLWAIPAAVGAASVYERLSLLPRRLRAAWRLGFVLLLGTAALYPVLATRARIEDRFNPAVGRTLDGSAFMRRAALDVNGLRVRLAEDAGAIAWILQHADGSPVVGEVNTYPTLYGWGNRFAMFTGNPAIVGWDYHQRQQRPAQTDLVRARITDVQRAYRTQDARAAHRIFRRYGVTYFVVGGLERALFPEGQAKWEDGVDALWTRVYAGPGTQVYRLAGAGVTDKPEAR
jgi:uncharacterized membrane protein